MKYFFLFTTLMTGLIPFYGRWTQDVPKKYHRIEITSSSVHVVEWNIEDTVNVAFVSEEIDSKGRTKELRFYNSNHELSYTGSGFYGGPIIRYVYLEDRIVETFYSREGEVAHDFRYSEVPYRFIYYLNNRNGIRTIDRKYTIDISWDNEDLQEVIDALEEYKFYSSEGSELNSVFGYRFSTAKLGGIAPQLE